MFSCVCTLWCSFAHICVFLRPTADRTTLFGNFRCWQSRQAWYCWYFSGVRKRVVSKRVVLADVPQYQNPERGSMQYQKPERGHIRQNRPFAKPPFCFLSNFVHSPWFSPTKPMKQRTKPRSSPPLDWSAANGGLRDGGLSKSQDIWGKRPFSSVFWIFQVLFAPSGEGRKRQKKGEKGRFRPISRKGGETPLKPPFVTPPFAAAQLEVPGLFRPRIPEEPRRVFRGLPAPGRVRNVSKAISKYGKRPFRLRKLPWFSFPWFFVGIPCFFLLQGSPYFLSVFPFSPKGFRGSPRQKILVSFRWFSLQQCFLPYIGTRSLRNDNKISRQ